MGAAIVCGVLVVAAIVLIVVIDFRETMRRSGNVQRHREARENMRGTYMHVHADYSTSFERVIRLDDEVDV